MNEHNEFLYQDTLSELNKDISLSQKLDYLHQILGKRFPFLSRIAVTIYDPVTAEIKTFIQSGDGDVPLNHYQTKLTESDSLMAIVNTGKARVINDLDVFNISPKEHCQKIRSTGYAASFTMPMFLNGEFFGFIFFNSREKNVFEQEVLHYLELMGHLLSLTVINELSNLRTLLAAIKTARTFTHHRDFETGNHLDRMSRYARLIAIDIAPKYGFDDEFIEHIFMFSPLHDIGKIGISDTILLKAGRLTEEERAIMQTHAKKGREIIDNMLENFGLDGLRHIDVLRNIAQHHHEAMDGSGYPNGLKKDEIPIESRIIAVADIFDALTSQRSYKDAWSNSDAFDTLIQMAGTQLDADCVDALLRHRAEIEEIQERFKEDFFG